MDQNSDVVVMLKNQIAELEEEKGNLQLQLLDTDESKTGQQCFAAVLCHDVALCFLLPLFFLCRTVRYLCCSN